MAAAKIVDKNKTQDELTRIAIINGDRCKPKNVTRNVNDHVQLTE